MTGGLAPQPARLGDIIETGAAQYKRSRRGVALPDAPPVTHRWPSIPSGPGAVNNRHLPMQKRPKISPSSASALTAPVISPRALWARRSSSASRSSAASARAA